MPIETTLSGYQQVIPRPKSDKEFIAVQPKCSRDPRLAERSAVGSVSNFNRNGRAEVDFKEEERRLEYAIISFWRYQSDGEQGGRFQCYKSFETAPLLPY